MKSTGRYCVNEASEEERLDKEMEDEIVHIKDYLHKYTQNINSLLQSKRASEVKKAMINLLVEQL